MCTSVLFFSAEEKDFNLLTTNFTFSPGSPREVRLEVELEDDPFFEGREDFTLSLGTAQPRVVFSPASTVVSIVDNEGI